MRVTALSLDPASADAATPLRAESLSAANINPKTWLATDYLNHFNEAIMLLELFVSDPSCRDDLLAWHPKTYREHFATSRFKDRQVALAAYDAADPVARKDLEQLSDMMSVVLQATCTAMRADLAEGEARALAGSVVSGLKPLVARAGAVINGETTANPNSQSTVDSLLNRAS